jgi:hypothetical protein
LAIGVYPGWLIDAAEHITTATTPTP